MAPAGFPPRGGGELDADVLLDPRLLAGPRAASLVVVLGLAERPTFHPRGVGRVDRVDSDNGVVGKKGADSEPLRGSDVISLSMSCHCNAAHQRTLTEAETPLMRP
jgi:hypothetical protein